MGFIVERYRQFQQVARLTTNSVSYRQKIVPNSFDKKKTSSYENTAVFYHLNLIIHINASINESIKTCYSLCLVFSNETTY